MSKILLIAPIDFNEHTIPNGILNLATILHHDNYDVEILELNYLIETGSIRKSKLVSDCIENIVNFIMSKSPEIIGFSCMCNDYHIHIMVSEIIKARNPKVKIFFGGPQASVTAIDTLKAFLHIDLIAIGEGELSIVDIIEGLLGNKEYRQIKGIAYKCLDNIIVNEQHELLPELDDLLLPNYKLLNNMDYLKLSIEAGRGCPFNCTFCSTQEFWKRKFRLKSIDRILLEIENAIHNYGIYMFEFVHDLFTASRIKTVEFCNRLLKEDLKIQWSCSARIDTLDEELIDLMYESGCREIFLGIETGSAKMQKITNKNLKLDDVKDTLCYLSKYKDMVIKLSFVYCFPAETEEDLKDTLDLISTSLKIGYSDIRIHSLLPFVGTEIYNEHKDELILRNSQNTCSYTHFCEAASKKILEYPSLFSQFYYIKTDISTQYNNLSLFINYFIVGNKMIFKKTLELLFDYFGGDLLRFYNAFNITFENLSNDIFDGSIFKTEEEYFDRSKLLQKIMLSSIGKFMKTYNFKEYTDIFLSVYTLEMKMYEFKTNINIFETIVNTSHDGHIIKKINLSLEDLKLYKDKLLLNEIKILLKRKNQHQISIQYSK
ncbi:B12-binding domain-containing radical SAM protein [Helicovermis profundi]|uniref:Uncharacterized protein n=1 Tax=Helicovermis profundi TaxID=3065157 RepID=A0AAU9E517_9FIRM|nr:hypothetical protein HLPR_20550 [Clostridia bacterium S502]